MSKPLVSASIAAPGFFGLNTQESSVTLEDGYASEATNCIIDKYGRLGARKGWIKRASPLFETVNYTDSSPYVDSFTETEIQFIKRVDSLANDTRTETITFKQPHGYGVGGTVTVVAWEATQPSYPIGGGFNLSFTFHLNNGSYIVTVVNGDFVSFNVPVYDYTIISPTELQRVVSSAGITEDLLGTGTDDITLYISAADFKDTLYGAHRFVAITGTETVISWGEDFYSGIAGDLTSITTTTANTITTYNWQAATLNDKAYFFQEGYNPMVYDAVSGEITDVSDSSCPDANTVLSAYGRLWAASTTTDKMTVYWSDLLDGENWSSGSAGSIDLTAIMVQGTDEIVGLGAQNGRLIVFTKRSTVIFGDSTGGSSLDPATLVLIEVINRVGCVARDSIQNTGSDIIFLSEDGLRSLGRVIQEKSQPLRDLSANIRDELVQAVQGQNVTTIKSVYSEDNAFYLLLLPQYNRIYCFDTRTVLPNGALRVTVWNNQEHTNMLSLPNAVYFTNSIGLCQYSGYLDNSNNYSMVYHTNYFDLGSATQTKILKKLNLTVIGLVNQDFIIKTAFDYIDSYRSYPAQLSGTTGAEYGTAEYNIAEYSVGTVSEPIQQSIGGSGTVIQVGFEATVKGSEFSIQKIDVFAKQGRII